MAHLSSCYFCGSAVETPVQTYELPGHPSDRTTVTLCPTCREKLAIVLDTAGASGLKPADDDAPKRALDGQSADTVTEDGNTGDRTNGQDDVTTDDESDTGPDGEPDQTVGVEEDSVEEATEAVEVSESDWGEVGSDTDGEGETPGSDDGVEEQTVTDEDDEEEDGGLGDPFEDEDLLPEDDPLAGEASVETGDDAAEDTPRSSDEDDFERDEAESAVTDEPGTPEPDTRDTVTAESTTQESTAEESRAVDESTTDESVADESTAEPSPDTESTADGDGGDDGGQAQSRASISALEYNRVMRMLQNREFPVDRDEIVVVAANAYDLAESECKQVIDLAVDRGLLEDRDGQLYRPEE